MLKKQYSYIINYVLENNRVMKITASLKFHFLSLNDVIAVMGLVQYITHVYS